MLTLLCKNLSATHHNYVSTEHRK